MTRLYEISRTIKSYGSTESLSEDQKKVLIKYKKELNEILRDNYSKEVVMKVIKKIDDKEEMVSSEEKTISDCISFVMLIDKITIKKIE